MTKREELVEVVNEYFKGEECPFTIEPILCQEGFCRNCYIHLQWREAVIEEIKSELGIPNP